MGQDMSLDRRVLVHLFDFVHLEDLWEVPWELSQEGIAHTIRTSPKSMPRVLRKMVQSQLLEEKLVHVVGAQRRRRAYFLTYQGLNQAQALVDTLLEEQVTLVEGPGEHEVSLRQARSRFPDRKVIDLYLTHRDQGRLVVEEKTTPDEEETPPSKAATLQIRMLDAAPTLPSRVLDREVEIDWLESYSRGGASRFLVVFGLAGMGKSTLVHHFINNHPEFSSYWHSTSEWDTPLTWLDGLALFFTRLDRFALSQAREQDSTLRLPHLLDAIREDCQDLALLLVVDNIHLASADLEQFFGHLLPALQHSKQVRVIFTSRQQPTFYSRREVKINRTVRELALEGLPPDHARDLLDPELSDELASKVIKWSAGHPLALELLDSTMLPRGESDMAQLLGGQQEVVRFLQEEIIDLLEGEEQSLLESTSVFRKSVGAAAVLDMSEANHSTLDTLVRKSLLQRNARGEYGVHDLLREVVHLKLEPGKRRRNHERAGRYFRERYGEGVGMESGVQLVYHMVRSDDITGAVKFLSENGEAMVENGQTELLWVLDAIPKNMLSGKDTGRLALLEGDLELQLGQIGSAREAYQRALEAWGRKGSRVPKEDITWLKCRLGYAAELLGDVDRAHGWIAEAMKLKRPDYGDPREWARIFNNLGVQYSNRGETATAVSYMTWALERLESVDDLRGQAMTLLNMGQVHEQVQDFTAARDLYEQARERGDEQSLEWARASYRLGVIALTDDDYQLAETLIGEARDVFAAAGHVDLELRCILRRGEIGLEKGEVEEARDTLQKGLNRATREGSQKRQAQFHEKLAASFTAGSAEAESHRKQAARAWAKSE